MERWSGRVAIVTGASAGIGATITQELVKKGLTVVGLARRVQKIEDLSKSLKSEKGKLHAVKCDISQEEDIKNAFQWVRTNLGGVDILINNAAVMATKNTIIDGPTEDWKQLLDINVLGVSICTKEALQSMKERGVNDGHIIHINSVLGHIPPPGILHMYCATKHAITALTEGLRRELVNQKSSIRVTSVSPGLVRTDMTQEFLHTQPSLNPEDVANAVLYVLGVPPHVQIHELTLMAVGAL